jgi:two-component system sensor histidine kinase KdpD
VTYLLAVVVMAITAGTAAAAITAVASMLIYDLLFIEPRFTLIVADPGEWLDLVVLLVVAIVVGQLAGLQRQRAEAAEVREREARALFRVNRALATARSADAAVPELLGIVLGEAGMTRAWVALDEEGTAGRIIADTDEGTSPQIPSVHVVLQRGPGDRPPVWARVHQPRRTRADAIDGVVAYRVRIVAGERPLGSLWSTRPRDHAEPSRSATRLLAAVADQVGGALERDRLARMATDAEIARRSDALKSSLLDSVSHDLRTPLATIRTAGGALAEPDGPIDAEHVRALGGAIDREARRLDRLVANLLDMSRMQAGDIRPHLAPHVLADQVEPVIARLRPSLEPRTLEVEVADSLPLVDVDEVMLDQALTNLLENASVHTPPEARVRVTALAHPPVVVLSVEDDGPGVRDGDLPLLFDKFYRAPASRRSRGRGTGIGLTVARGMARAMGGDLVARRSELGGLAFDCSLPIASPAPDPAAGTAV